jgi:hypothetical protein
VVLHKRRKWQIGTGAHRDEGNDSDDNSRWGGIEGPPAVQPGQDAMAGDEDSFPSTNRANGLGTRAQRRRAVRRRKGLDDLMVRWLPGCGPVQVRRQLSGVLTAAWSGSIARLTGDDLGDVSREESGTEQRRSGAVRCSAWSVSGEGERERERENVVWE